MKNILIIVVGLGAVFSLMYFFVYEPDNELEVWCENFLAQDDGSIDEPLMQTIRQRCKEA
tara:strand:- start:337 stop:516 length:180 start_codon:yes stop_codon:yes gene_type:complete